MGRTFLAAAIVAAGLALPVHATAVLDQHNWITITTPGNQLLQGIGGVFDRRQAQVVTAGKTGLLTRLDLEAGRVPNAPAVANNLVIELLHGGAASLPAGPGASPLVVPGTSVPGRNVVDQMHYVTLDVSSLHFHVVAGQQFMIYSYAQSAINQSRFGLLYGEEIGIDIDGNSIVGSNADYAAGKNYITDNSGGLPWQETIYDRGFRTYVNTVPEPAAWALMVAGFGLVGTRRRHARVVAA